MRKLVASAAVAGLTLLAPHPGLPQSSDELKVLKNEIRALKEGQDAIKKELQELRRLFQARPGSAAAEVRNITLSVDDSPMKGDRLARVTLFDFSDYQ